MEIIANVPTKLRIVGSILEKENTKKEKDGQEKSYEKAKKAEVDATTA